MKLLPYRAVNGEIFDGEYIKGLSFCKNNCNRNKCKDFYRGLNNRSPNCFYTCPYGMSVFLNADGSSFIGFRERESYDKSKAKCLNTTEVIYNPILDKSQFVKLIELSYSFDSKEIELLEKKSSVDNISHEVKQLNAQIKDKSNVILQTYKLDEENVALTNDDIRNLQEAIRTIYVSSAMISSRFSLYDYEKSPEALRQGAQFECVVYKKFDKIRKIFRNYMNRQIPINIIGSSYVTINAYPSFELIPLLLIENAVKYSYDTPNAVDIVFEENSHLVISINSYSPYCSEEESKLIFEKGYRGKNAQRVSDGSGIGLYFVKMLCDLHNIAIVAESDKSRISSISGIAYAPFSIKLEIPNISSI